MNTALLFAFTAGAVATVNPCGFALLPAWFAAQVAGQESGRGATTFLRATRNGAAAAVGFVVVFAAAGVLVSSGSLWLGSALKYFGTAVGAILIAVGLMQLTGLRLPNVAGVNTCRRISDRHGALGFGLSYGVVSLSCTLPIFMAVLGTSLLGGGELNLVNLVAFLLGASSVLVVVSVAAALSGTGLTVAARLPAGAIRRLSGALVAVAGVSLFLSWVREFDDVPDRTRRMLDEGSYLSSSLNIWLSEGPGLAVSGIGLVLILAGLWLAWRRTGAGSSDTGR
ncbi:MAG: cytochrome c biogenesis CcdA family protein [Paracoccaceae bacterium]